MQQQLPKFKITTIKKIKPIQFVPGIAWFFLVLTLLCLPASDIPQVQDWLSKIYFDKWVHAGLFGIMGLLFMSPITKSSLQKKQKLKWLIKITVAIILWGITTEFIQKFYIPGRFFDFLDWSADTFGTICAFIMNKIWLNKQERTSQN